MALEHWAWQHCKSHRHKYWSRNKDPETLREWTKHRCLLSTFQVPRPEIASPMRTAHSDRMQVHSLPLRSSSSGNHRNTCYTSPQRRVCQCSVPPNLLCLPIFSNKPNGIKWLCDENGNRIENRWGKSWCSLLTICLKTSTWILPSNWS